MSSIKNREDLEKLKKLISLNNQLEDLHLQMKLGKQNFQENVKKLQEPLIDTIINTSENITKIFLETYNKNNKAIERLNEKVLELMKDKGMIAQYITFYLVNSFKPEIKS